MTLAVIRAVNQQRPDVEVVVDFEKAPQIVREAFASSDVVLSPPGGRYATTIQHLAYDYDRVDEPFVAGMVRCFNEVTKLDVKPPHDWPQFRAAKNGWMTHYGAARGVVGLVSCGRGHMWGKEWPHFGQLAQTLREHNMEVCQLGHAKDRPLGADFKVLDASFGVLAATMCRMGAFVGLENGLMVLAGMLNVPQVTVYSDDGDMRERISFERRTSIPRAKVDDVLDALREKGLPC